MIELLLPEIDRGAAVLTANRRLARALSREYDSYRRDSGATVWTTPRILPFGVWLQSVWSDALLDGSVTARLLAASQEQALWERIIRRSEAGRDLLSPRDAARACAEAWAITRQD